MCYDTALSPQQEKAFKIWKARLPRDLQNEADYDLRGAFLADSRTAANGHMGDRFKKPNHITFSDESQYSNALAPGGHWASAGGDQYAFWASPFNVANSGVNALASYFGQNEPGNTVVFPFGYRLPPR